MSTFTGLVHQINVKPRIGDERGIPKLPIQSQYLLFAGFEDDFNRYRTEKKQGTLDRAVLIIPLETIHQLQQENWPIQPGHLGENITTQGIPYDSFSIGNKYQVGNAAIEITEACLPCANLRVLDYVGLPKVSRFMKTLIDRRGWYAKVIEQGRVNAYNIIRQIE